jgi:transcription elongation factor GreA
MSERLPMTRAGYAKLEEELRRLKAVERPKIVKEIELARAHGDISENAEFHAAKERQSHVEGRVRQLEDKLARAVVIDPTGQSTEEVRFGVTVQLEDTETGDRVTYTILGEGNPTSSTAASRSPHPSLVRCWEKPSATA